MIAYKFLRRGAVGRYSDFRWPRPAGDRPGAWVEVEGPLRLAANAIHACRIEQLSYWLDTELWEFELDEPAQDADKVLLGRRGRLLRPIDGWTEETAREFVRASAERSRTHATGALRAGGAHDQASALDACHGPEQLMANAAAAAEGVSGPLAAILLDSADVAFASHGGMSACLVAYLAARVARGAAEAANGSASDAELAERRWQALWLAERLELPTA